MTNPTVKIGSITLYFSAFLEMAFRCWPYFLSLKIFQNFIACQNVLRSQCFTLFGASVLHVLHFSESVFYTFHIFYFTNAEMDFFVEKIQAQIQRSDALSGFFLAFYKACSNLIHVCNFSGQVQLQLLPERRNWQSGDRFANFSIYHPPLRSPYLE